jgi:hypothetical protein
MIESTFTPDRGSLFIGIICFALLMCLASWLVYQIEVKGRYKSVFNRYKPLVSMLAFFTAFTCMGILVFNVLNFASMKPVYISGDFLQIGSDQIPWSSVGQVENKLIDEVGLFGDIKPTDERVLEIRKMDRSQAPILLSEKFYPVEDIYQAILRKTQ